MLKQCSLSPATLEVMLNSYTSVPPCEWIDSVSTDINEVSPSTSSLPLRPPALEHLSVSLPLSRTTGLSSSWCVSGAASLALCSICVDVLYACTSGPGAALQSVNWRFPAL